MLLLNFKNNCCSQGTLWIRHIAWFVAKKCPNYHLNDTVVVIIMMTMAAVINEIIHPIINMTSPWEIMGIMDRS